MTDTVRIVGGIAVVTATADFHPLREIKLLTAQLASLSFEGMVLFDLLSVNGLAPNRFASMKFLGNRFDRSSFAVEDHVNPAVRREQNLIAKNDQTFLHGSVLSTDEMKRFMH
ncbi:type II toxin-antitoxin system RnlB family antitoxin [Ruegeria faecimaris]|uniref:type II toxin-antitoxin system RnlB family antitoxin n=1 Tax=Ruegeria faecimaris TaxID=686389 RepID=UPI0024911E27|nr:type II toxin-antitoxin system RnlB family antitoxin [Ruegeria faecimaris]